MVKDGAIWREGYEKHSLPPDPPYVLSKFQFYMTGDTIFFSNTFKKLFLTDYAATIKNKIYIGAMRQDSLGKVYFIMDTPNTIFFPGWFVFDSTEAILYDFSLMSGDTFHIPYGLDPIQIVDSVDTVLISGKWRKRIIFKNTNSIRGAWIEGIGDTKGLFFPSIFEIENNFLACYEDSQVFWKNPKISFDCLSLGIIDKTEINSGIKISPNPANTEITIEFDEGVLMEEKLVIIYNSIGTEVKSFTVETGKTSHTLKIGDLEIGVYFVRVITESKRILN